MAFRVRLYEFSKRENSTARPSGSGRLFDCVIKSGSGIIYPTINIDIGMSEAMTYNYAYIDDFDRYYWIIDAVNRGPVWELKLKVDALASWRDTIGSTSLYILRSSASYDGNILDTYYPASTNSSMVIKSGYALWPSSDTDIVVIGDGEIVVGVVSQDAKFGSIAYYALSMSDFSTLCANLLDNTFWQGKLDANDASIELQKSLIDPLQFIKTCIWIPGSTTGSSQTVYVNDWSTGVSGKLINFAQPFIGKYTDITIDNHPQISRGRYLNYPPYTVMWLDVPPFGVIQLDPTILRDSTLIQLWARVDIITGVGTLKITDNNSVLLNSLTAQVGVPVNLSQVTRDYVSAATGAVNATANTIQSALWGNIAGAVSAAASGIETATKALCPRVQSLGSTGNFSSLYGKPRLYEQFFTIADEDLSHNGRPLCKVSTPANLGGFMMVLDGDISAPATDTELQTIRGHLESGFYYE